MYSTLTLDWFAVFLMTMLLWQSELKSPAYRFPLSRRCHSNGGTTTASMFVVSLAPSLPAAKWKKTSQRLIYMVMVWSPTFCPRPVANQMAKNGLCSWKSKLFLLYELPSPWPWGLVSAFFRCQENSCPVLEMKGMHGFLDGVSSNLPWAPGYSIPKAVPFVLPGTNNTLPIFPTTFIGL